MGAVRELADGVSQQSKPEAASSGMSNWETIISFIVPLISVSVLNLQKVLFFPPCVGVKFLFNLCCSHSIHLLEFEKFEFW